MLMNVPQCRTCDDFRNDSDMIDPLLFREWEWSSLSVKDKNKLEIDANLLMIDRLIDCIAKWATYRNLVEMMASSGLSSVGTTTLSASSDLINFSRLDMILVLWLD